MESDSRYKREEKRLRLDITTNRSLCFSFLAGGKSHPIELLVRPTVPGKRLVERRGGLDRLVFPCGGERARKSLSASAEGKRASEQERKPRKDPSQANVVASSHTQYVHIA